MLSETTPRCQGRMAVAAGTVILARECVKCERRTSPWPVVQKAVFITPPKGWFCDMRIEADEVQTC
jgi:hypothetical protein